MNTDSAIQKAAEILIGEQRRLERELEGLEDRVNELHGDLERVDFAIAALRGEEATPRRELPSLSKATVLDHVRELLRGEQRLPVEQLRDRVAQRLKGEGRSLLEYPRRFEQVIRELQRVNGDEVALPSRN